MEILKNINPGAVQICRTLQEAGHQAFIVGGCVRDLILGQIPKDWDITTSAKPVEVMLLFPDTYPTGLQHGTITVSLGEGIENHFEVTTFRVEGEYLDGRRPNEVIFVVNVKEDLARRDLTINAIAYDPISQQMIDPFGGQEDLKNKVIKAVGNANERFQEDGLRIMRAARFAARFNYELELNTFYGMKKNLDTLHKVSIERIQDELCKTLMTEHPEYGLEILKDCGALAIACPHLMSIPALTAFLHEQDLCKGELETRIAFLYSNCTEIEKIEKELLNLKFSNKEIKRTIFLIKLLDQYSIFRNATSIENSHKRAEAAKIAYVDFIATIKNQSPDPWEYTLEQFILFTEPVGIDSRQQIYDYSNVTVYSRKEMKINGNDLLLIGIKPGPQIKTILDNCYAEILKEPAHNDEGFLLSFASGNWKIEKVPSIN